MYAIGIIGTKLVMFVLIPVLSFFLNKSDLGVYDLILVSITLLTPLITLQIADGVYRFLLEERSEGRRPSIITTASTFLLTGLFLLSVLGYYLFPKAYNQLYWPFVFLQASFCFTNLLQQSLRGLQLNKEYAVFGVTNALTIVIATMFVIFSGMSSLYNFILALSLAQFAALIFGVLYSGIFRYFSLRSTSIQLTTSMLKYSWPLLPNSVSWWLIDLGNRFLILYFLSEEWNGIYAVAARYAGIVALFNSIFILSWQDHTIGEDPNQINVNHNFFNRYMIFELTLVVLITSSASFLIEFTAASEFEESKNYLPLLLLSSGFSAFCAFLGAYYLKAKNTKEVFTTTLAGGVLNFIISVGLIQTLGLYAVALGSVAGFACTFVLRKKRFSLQINYLELCTLLAIFLVTTLVQFSQSHELKASVLILMTGYFIYKNKDLLLKIKEKFLLP
ncbi:hypothetical protein BST99_11350 [Aureicoccus marinus]|uniref:Polysaccharide biosynthesis protein C-terminal domain-containing protein n=1 Tax=Aureicoccus marinus TaxID=754435 RepID=A0A2S7T9K8_9FLAO|nr:hypothetical protein BST99_11350 [Aureicoccus marinus]